jgi:5'-nucleotidase
MSYLLLTNDDGVDSPALIPFYRALSEIAPVHAVVPDQERSWIGKAITRFDEVHVRRVTKAGVEIAVADGFPADCAQLGIHSLFGEKPMMVISGINVGLNNGLGFFLSSGTVGAAAEGWIAGLPAVAFSTGNVADHRGWAKHAWSDESTPMWEQAAALSVDVLKSILDAGYPPGVDLLSVNFASDIGLDAPRRVTDIAKIGYDNIFREASPGRFVHDFATGLRIEGEVAGTDVEALAEGWVSITPVRLAHGAPIDEATRSALEGR